MPVFGPQQFGVGVVKTQTDTEIERIPNLFLSRIGYTASIPSQWPQTEYPDIILPVTFRFHIINRCTLLSHNVIKILPRCIYHDPKLKNTFFFYIRI